MNETDRLLKAILDRLKVIEDNVISSLSNIDSNTEEIKKALDETNQLLINLKG